MDVAGHEGEGQAQLAFQHVQSQVEVTEHGITTPEWDLEARNVLIERYDF
jgi:hypothetical protein